MTARAFYEQSAESEVARVVEGLERESGAEVVVAVRAISGHYAGEDSILGFLFAYVGLMLFLFHPTPIRIEGFALEFPLLFGIGMALSMWVPPVRRLLTSRERLQHSATTAARAAFVELGVSRTRARTGLLVFVSMFERKVVVVTDVGIERTALGDALVRLETVLDRHVDLPAFVAALDGLSAPLKAVCPRALDDENELADAVRVV